MERMDLMESIDPVELKEWYQLNWWNQWNWLNVHDALAMPRDTISASVSKPINPPETGKEAANVNGFHPLFYERSERSIIANARLSCPDVILWTQGSSLRGEIVITSPCCRISIKRQYFQYCSHLQHLLLSGLHNHSLIWGGYPYWLKN